MSNHLREDRNLLDRAPHTTEAAPGAATLLHVLWQRRWLVLGTVIACVCASGLYLVFSTPIYSSTAQIYIQENAPKAYSDAVGPARQSEGFLNSQADILQSAPVLTRALDAVNWRRMKTFAKVKGDPVAFLQQSREISLDIEPVKRTDIVSVTMESPYPSDAAALVNAVCDAYVTERAGQDKFTGTAMVAALDRQRNDLQQRRDACIEAMLAFKREHGVTSFKDDKANILLQRTAVLSTQLNAAELEVWDLRARHDAAASTLERPDALSAFVQALQYKDRQAGDHEFDDLRTQLIQQTLALATCEAVQGHNNQRVQVLSINVELLKHHIAEKERAIAQAYLSDLSVQLASTTQREQSLRLAMAEQQRRMIEMDPVSAQFAKLESESDRLQKEAELLEGRISEVRVNTGAGPLNIQVLEPARVAQSPIKPRKSLVLGSAGLVGWLLGVGLALLGELSAARVRSPDEVRITLGVPVVAMVPRINPRLSPVARGQVVYLDPRSTVSEAYRSVRTSLNLGAAVGARTVLVASPASGDGKSTTASNLAIAFAQAGQRTLLIDADLRGPVQHLIFEVDGIVGLSSVIAGEAKLRQAVRPTRVPGLFVLPCGPVPANPSELIGDKRFEKLMVALSGRFDRVVIDSPALSNVADALMLAAAADATLLVLRMNHSVRRLGVLALDSLEKVGANVVGVIANDMSASRAYGYYGGGSWQYATHARHVMISDGPAAIGHANGHAHASVAGANGNGAATAVMDAPPANEPNVEEPDWSADLPPANEGA